jgi:hypothetical protein
MSLQLPEGIDPQMLAQLAGQGAPPLPQGLQDQAEPGEDQGGTPLDCLKEVIDDFPKLLTELQDPRDVQDAVKALQILAGVQTRLMTAGQAANGPQAG